MQSLLILGRQPALSLAELESLYGSAVVHPIGTSSSAALLDVDPCLLAFDRLGGSIKFCKVLTTLPTTKWPAIEKFLLKVSPGHAETMPEGKMQLGLSAYGLDMRREQLGATGLRLKKAIRATGRSVRLVPNNDGPTLQSAQVYHNHLTGPNGWELVFVRDGDSTIIAQTVKIQDITAYTKRDQQRPNRDAKVGMLPPKLAQIIVNLATGPLDPAALSSMCDIPAGAPLPDVDLKKTILDPFCGSGVILQEAALMGYHVYGTDIDERMVRYSTDNLAWLEERYNRTFTRTTAAGDATAYTWEQPVDFVASETYLGRPFTSPPPADTLTQTIADCNLIIKKFLRHWQSQAQPGSRLCLAVPAWQIKPNQFKHLPLIDQIEDLGYNRVSFEHVRPEELIYYRPDQFVARELLVITRK